MQLKRIFITIACLGLCASAHALKIPDRTNRHVNDYAQVIDAQSAATLETLLTDFEKKKGIEIEITVIQTLEGMSIENFVRAYFPKWRHVWPFEKDRRCHVIVVVQEATVQIGVGNPLMRVLTMKKIDEITDNVFIPRFKERQFSRGLLEGTAKMIEYLQTY